MFEFMYVPTILFMVIVAPIWLAMHYKSTRQSNQGLNQDDRQVLDDMIGTIDKLGSRIEALESILDAEHSDWRERNARTQQRN
jgi:phage shock protein B